jgi:hypothetical protein
MRVNHEIILPSSDASMNQNSLAGLLAHVWGCSIQAIITGTAAGSIKLQGSSDSAPDANFSIANYPVVNWTDISGSTQSVSGTGTVYWDISRTAASWIRVVYTASSGTGTISVQIFTKGF